MSVLASTLFGPQFSFCRHFEQSNCSLPLFLCDRQCLIHCPTQFLVVKVLELIMTNFESLNSKIQSVIFYQVNFSSYLRISIFVKALVNRALTNATPKIPRTVPKNPKNS